LCLNQHFLGFPVVVDSVAPLALGQGQIRARLSPTSTRAVDASTYIEGSSPLTAPSRLTPQRRAGKFGAIEVIAKPVEFEAVESAFCNNHPTTADRESSGRSGMVASRPIPARADVGLGA
jgi:hypothetical protein